MTTNNRLRFAGLASILALSAAACAGSAPAKSADDRRGFGAARGRARGNRSARRCGRRTVGGEACCRLGQGREGERRASASAGCTDDAGRRRPRDRAARRARAATAPAEAKKAGEDSVAAAPVQQQGVKAGEWDDNANYREFQKWLAGESRLGFHKVDVSSREFLVVRDANGKGIPRCNITVRNENQRTVSLTDDGLGSRAPLPARRGARRRAQGDLFATARCDGLEKTTRFSVTGNAGDGVIDIQMRGARKAPVREVDLGFVLDTTGSMSEEITAVKATIQKVARSLGGDNVKIKVGLVEYKDRGDPFVTKVYPMTEDLARFSRQVEGLSAGGGGDYPESVNEGLHVALNRLDWGGTGAVKMAVLVGDAPPHLDYPNDFDYAVDMKDAAHRGIQVFTIAASGMDELGQVVWRQIAQYTDATNLFVMRGGAGPQSTGAGDPRSSCGGTQTQYRSGNLDALITERVRRELKSIDGDPMRIPGAGTDENAKPCSQRLQVAFN